jgi:transposase
MGNPKGVPRDFVALERRRFRALPLFARGFRPAQVARRLGVHRQSAARWRQTWRSSGWHALQRAPHAGRNAKLRGPNLKEALRHLRRLASRPQSAMSMGSAAAIGAVLLKRTGISYHPAHLSRWLRRHGFVAPSPRKTASRKQRSSTCAPSSGWQPMRVAGLGQTARKAGGRKANPATARQQAKLRTQPAHD